MSRDEFSDATLVVLGHGTDLNAHSAMPAQQLAATLHLRGLFRQVVPAFWKQQPQVKTVLAQIKTPRIFIVPLMISEGYFTSEIIPQALGLDSDFKLKSVERELIYCKPVGTHSSMANVLLARARAVVDQFPFPRAPKPKDITLFIAGHGTERNIRSKEAIETQVTALRAHQLYAAVHAVYLDENPRIKDCQLIAETKHVVVVPFFISDGLHTAEDIPVLLGEAERVVKARLAAGQPTWRNPTEVHGKLTWYAQAIGSEPLLAEVVMARVREAAQSA